LTRHEEQAFRLELVRSPSIATTVVRLLASLLTLSVTLLIDGGPVFWTAIGLAAMWAILAIGAFVRGRTRREVCLTHEGITLPSPFLRVAEVVPWEAIRFALAQASGQHGVLRIGVRGKPFARLLHVSDVGSRESFDRVCAFVAAHVGGERYLDLSSRAWYLPWVTIAIALCIAGSFLCGVLWLDTPDSIRAITLGAYQTQLFTGGDWFRLNSFSVAHLDYVHFALNLFIFVAICAELEERMGRAFVAGLIGLSSLGAGIAIALLPTGHDITLGASGICYGAMAALLLLSWRAPDLAPPSFRLVPLWWLSLMLVVDIVNSIVNPGISLAGHLGGLVGGAALTLASLHSRRAGSPGLQRGVGVLGLSAAAFFVACLGGLLHAGMTTSPREVAERLLAADIAADTALDVANFVSTDAGVGPVVLERAFGVLSDPDRAGIDKVTDGPYGVLREDTLGRLAWRLDKLGEARAHGLDAVRRSEDVAPDERQRLLARLATYESSARLPPFVPAAVLVRAGTLCVLVPNGNPRQYIRAVARNGETVTGIVLGTVDPGETRCIPAEGVTAKTRVALTAAERAVLTSDLVYRPVDIAAAGLLPRGTG
jgi:membrane associated rhomboid family serine protease